MAVMVVPPHVHHRAPWLGPAARRLNTVVRSAISVTGEHLFAQHKASLKRLTEIPLTVAGFGFGDFAAFHISHGWGFAAIAVSLLVVEHLISDDA